MHMTTVSHRHSGKQKSYPRLFVVIVCSTFETFQLAKPDDKICVGKGFTPRCLDAVIRKLINKVFSRLE